MLPSLLTSAADCQRSSGSSAKASTSHSAYRDRWRISGLLLYFAAIVGFPEVLALRSGDRSGPWKVRDLWAKKDLGGFRDSFRARLASHETQVVRLRPA
jgi:hypothetical protein